MPSEYTQSAQRPESSHRRSNSSIHSETNSASGSPPQHKPKVHKHVVGRGHARVPSTKSLHKLTKSYGNEDSHVESRKVPRNFSASSLKKNNSHLSLKRNRSSADVTRRPKSSQGQVKRPSSVHFQIGDQNPEDGGWEEASSSASPALSRSVSRPSSAKASAENTAPHSPIQSTVTHFDGENERRSVRSSTADAKIITERLLQRTPSLNTTKMSLETAAPSATRSHSPDSLSKSHNSTANGTPRIGSREDMVSRFVGGSGTPGENSPYLNIHKDPKYVAGDEVKKSKSMNNLSRAAPPDEDEETSSALAPRSRKSSTTHAYNPPQQSRTQQKLWLQRASSNMEPQQMAPGATMNGISGMQGGLTGLVGTGFDGRDPRLKIQLERTGLEYLVVRRYQDPVGQALKRLSKLPGAEKNRAIVGGATKNSDGAEAGALGLSQSLREGRKPKSGSVKDKRSSYDGGTQDDGALSGRGNSDEGVETILRSLWERNHDLGTSAD